MEGEAVLADEGRNAADRAASQVLRSASNRQVDGRDLDIEAIGLGDGLDGDGAGVALEGAELSATRILEGKRVQSGSWPYLAGEKGSESHFDCISQLINDW